MTLSDAILIGLSQALAIIPGVSRSGSTMTVARWGHEHNYSRRLINSSFNEDDYTFNHRISQIITGGAGAPLNSNLRDSRNLINGPLGIYHYIIVDVVGSEALFYVLGINNVLLDSFRIVR
jgi:hypothetical protein